MNKKDTRLLKWLHARLINAYREDRNVDFVEKLECIIERCEIRHKEQWPLIKHPSLSAGNTFSVPCKEISEFEKEINTLSIILNKDCTNNSLIIALINWAKSEAQKRLKPYSGDDIVIRYIQNEAFTEPSLEISVMKAFAILDKTLN